MAALTNTAVGLWLMSTLITLAAGADYVATATLYKNGPPVTSGQQQGSFIVGTITFKQTPGDSKVTIQGDLKLEDGFKFINTSSIGFHVHAISDFTNGCVTAGAHYNPENKTHGGPNDTMRHVGDLGNVYFDPTTFIAKVSFSDNVISLVGHHTIVGRSLVLHAGTDDLGKGGWGETATTGNAGTRYACGPIILASDFSPSSAISTLSSGRIMMAILIATFSIVLFRW